MVVTFPIRYECSICNRSLEPYFAKVYQCPSCSRCFCGQCAYENDYKCITMFKKPIEKCDGILELQKWEDLPLEDGDSKY